MIIEGYNLKNKKYVSILIIDYFEHVFLNKHLFCCFMKKLIFVLLIV